MFGLYRRIFRPRTIPWPVALFLGALFGLLPWLSLLMRPEGRDFLTKLIENPNQSQLSIAYIVLSALAGAVFGAGVLRIVFGKFQLLGPLLVTGVGAIVLEWIGVINRWQAAGVVWLLLGLAALLTYVLYVGRSTVGCHACNGRGQVHVTTRGGADLGYETCSICGGSGAMSQVTASVIQTLFFLGVAGVCFLISYASFFKHP